MNDPYHINCLPAELLLSIFRLTETRGRPHGLPGLVIVSHVCRRWRYLTLQTHSLWTVISISNKEKDYAHHARVWLERSGALPVDITVYWDSALVERRAEATLFPIDDAAPWADETSHYVRRSYMEYERFRELERQSLMRELDGHKHRWRSFKWSVTSVVSEENADADVLSFVFNLYGDGPSIAVFQAVITILHISSPKEVLLSYKAKNKSV
ncbi:hypothetical protein K503DRAFT_799929 [Rhizopogon vinicolor AM-OR11-026]|uniref:F-box domain-containing protein n=1 Tax=Rhizopogon vinicolor AM-OR11-026 TaxID=1314800 RepID=A0A1B7N2J0_9AGAM|nr:hypothetical protein K503DRAFT_799929 [Rhizopogon vinicolor AM-OR11-026]